VGWTYTSSLILAVFAVASFVWSCSSSSPTDRRTPEYADLQGYHASTYILEDAADEPATQTRTPGAPLGASWRSALVSQAATSGRFALRLSRPWLRRCLL